MSLQPVIVRIERPARKGDGSGGKTKEPVVIHTRLNATQNFYSRTSLLRLEQAAHNTQGPGLMIEKKQFFVFRQQPAPDIQVQDNIVREDGTRFVVQFVRGYGRTLQVDTEIVQ